MDANTITAKLHKQADEELTAELHKVLTPFVSYLERAGVYVVPVTPSVNGNPPAVPVRVQTYKNAAFEAAFEALKDKRRNKHVEAFIEKIGSIEQQLEDLGQYRD